MRSIALIPLLSVPAALGAPASKSLPFGPLTTDIAQELAPGLIKAEPYGHNESSVSIKSGDWESYSKSLTYTKSASDDGRWSSLAKRAIPTALGPPSYSESWGPEPTASASGFSNGYDDKFSMYMGGDEKWKSSMKSGDWESHSHTYTHTKSASANGYWSSMAKRAIPTPLGSHSYGESWGPGPTAFSSGSLNGYDGKFSTSMSDNGNWQSSMESGDWESYLQTASWDGQESASLATSTLTTVPTPASSGKSSFS
jgi:hypothetical protein